MVQNIFPTIFGHARDDSDTFSTLKTTPHMKKSIFSKITTPILHKFQSLHGVTPWLPTFAVPQKGWSNTSFITPESCIALDYSEPYEKSVPKRYLGFQIGL